MTTTESLNDYARRLDSALRENKEYEETNRDLSHAFVVIILALHHAKESCLLLSNCLDKALYGQPPVLHEIKQFLEKGMKLDILVERDVEGSHPLIELVRNYKETASIRKIPEERVQTYGYNFLVIDDRGFRFERDRQQPNAYVAFRGQVSGSEEDRERAGIINRLKEIFEDLKQASTPLSISL